MPGPNTVDVYVGKRLRFARTLRGMSQEALGASIGVTFQQIQKYERGINCIRSGKLYELSKTLGLSVGFFFEEIDEENNENYRIPGASDSGSHTFDSNLNVSKDAIELIRVFNKIDDPHLRRKTLDLVKAMASNLGMFDI